MGEEGQRRHFKKWPMALNYRGQKVIDKQKIKDEYLANPHYDWNAFCKLKGYNDGSRQQQEFPVKSWQQEWIEKQVSVQDEDVKVKAVAIRAAVLNRRLSFVTNWTERAEKLKNLLDYSINRHQMLAHIENIEVKRCGDDKARVHEVLKDKIYKGSGFEILQLASAAKTLQELEMRALLVNPSQMTDATNPDGKVNPMLPVPIKTESERMAEMEQESLADMPVQIIGEGGAITPEIKVEKIQEILAGWYDKAGEFDPIAHSQPIPDGDPTDGDA